MNDSRSRRARYHALLLSTFAAGAGMAAAACAQTQGTAADTVFRNGSVYTADAKDSIQQAVAVKDGRIVYVGSNAGVARFVGQGTKTIDLEGRMMMPGMIDGHIHPLSGGGMIRACNLNYQPLTEAQFLAGIQTCLDADGNAGPDDILQVRGWYRQFMRPKGFDASRETLDKLKTNRPVLVVNRDGHSSLANSRALDLAGITDQTPNPPGGTIIRDANGRATGILEDAAAHLVSDKMPHRTLDDDLKDGVAAMHALSAAGITTMLDAGASAKSLEIYHQLQRRGDLTVRTHAAVLANAASATDASAVIANVVQLRSQYDQPETMTEPGLRVHTSKLMMDGVIQAPAQTAGLVEPYWVNIAPSDAHEHWQPGTRKGPVYIRQDMLEAIMVGLAKAGIDPHVHAIGDRSVKLTLDGFEKVRQAVPGDTIRPAIAHAELVEPVDYARFKTLNVVPAMSYQWTIPAPNSVTGAKNQLGPERFERMEPFDKLRDAGVRVVYGSDWPVDKMNYWVALKAAITRAGDGTYAPEFSGRLNNAGVLTRTQALRSITIDGAWALHLDKETGSIEPGKLADLIVLDRNFLTVPEDTLATNKVHLTMVGGKVVHDDNVLTSGAR